MKRILFLTFTLSTLSDSFAHVVQDTCFGPTALLNIINRPTNSDSPCVVPFKKLFIQSGFQYQELIDSNGRQQNLPNAVLRLGLPTKNEFIVLLPNYTHQSQQPPTQGETAMTLGFKHQLGYNDKWIVAVEEYITPPSGGVAFGSAGTGTTINGIMNYSVNKKPSFTSMLGGSTQTQPKLSGGGRYSSVNPDFVLTYSLKDKLNLYAEVYGQSQTGLEQGWG